MQQPVLVTGGAGYIGSHTAKALALAGYTPVVLDDLSTGHRWAVKWGPLVEGDIGDKPLLCRIIDRYSIGAVIHFAAKAYVGESMQYPRKYFQSNVVKSLDLLHALIDCQVSKVVFSSSCATYGIPERLPIDEDNRQCPVNPYGDSKLFVEKALRWYEGAYGLRSVCLRYFNAAGADPEGEIGELHNPETHLIPLVLQAAIGLSPKVTIFGTDYPTPDGTAIRDYIHVSDLADAHVRALEYLANNSASTAINLGTECGHSVRDVIRCAEEVSRRQLHLREEPRRPGDPAVLVASTRRAEQLLGWKPRFTKLRQIVESAYEWLTLERKVVAAAI